MHLPLISIVVSTYNGEKFLKEQIDSIIEQTYPNLEIIIADDASTDNTRKIISGYQSYPSIKIIYRENNIGYSQNFYEAAISASGDYIAFSDQDDIWLPEKITTLYHAIVNHFLVYSNSELIKENKEYIGKKLSDVRKMGDVKSTIGFFLDNVAWGHTILIKKELLKYFLPLPQNVEYDKWLAVLATCLTGIKYVDEPLTLYRQHFTSITKTIIEKSSGARKNAIRYNDFQKQLLWLETLKNNPLEKEKEFYAKFYQLFLKKKKGYFVWPLFFFMLKHEKQICNFRPKSFLSNVMEIRKLARGEKEIF